MARPKKLMRFPSAAAVARLRALKWRQRPERRLRHERDAAEFVREVRLCLHTPVGGLLLPSFQEAVAGRVLSRTARPREFPADGCAATLEEVLHALIQQRVVFDTNCLWRTPVLVARELFSSLYAMGGDANPEEDYLEQRRRGELGAFEVAVYEAILREGPVVKSDLRSTLRLSTEREDEALDKALQHLWRMIKVVRASHSPDRGAAWDAFFRWAPEVVREARSITRLEAAMRILIAFVDEAVVVARTETQKMFSGFLTREVCGRALDLLVESGQMVEWKGKLATPPVVRQ